MKTSKKAAPSRAMTLRLDAATLRQLERLAEVTDRSKAWLAAQAVKDFLELNEWQTQAISDAVKQANSPDAKFVDHAKIDAWLSTWGGPQERKPQL